MELIKKEKLIVEFFDRYAVICPILDKEALMVFFEEEDRIFNDLDKISSLLFLYVPQNDGFCPTVKCKISYKLEYQIKDSEWFIYDELDDEISSSYFQMRLEKYISWFDNWIEFIHNRNIANGEKGLELANFYEFMRATQYLLKYLPPREELLKLIDEKFVIIDKKFA